MKKASILSFLILIVEILIAQILPFNAQLKPFYHGVASGDPMEDRVIIWTRITPDRDTTITGTYIFATDIALKNMIKIGTFSTDSSKDYTVKMDVTGLQSNTTYYYAFIALGKRSCIGRTKTTPTKYSDTPSVLGNNLSDVLKFAVVSCANYEGGYFNAYARIADRNDLNAVIHLGDYYYDYSMGSHRNSKLKDLTRNYIPIHKTVTKTDYRLRLSLYHLDKNLQKVHQQHPFITIWDDHEIANNAYETGAKSNKGDWNVRKKEAKEAYFEWMPIRGTAENCFL
jgi:alkaline phosphatase D